MEGKIHKSNTHSETMQNTSVPFRPCDCTIIFLFIISSSCIPLGIFYMIYCYDNLDILLFVGALFITLIGIADCGWIGSFLSGGIIISKDRIIIDHAARLLNKENAGVQIWQWGIHHVNVSWDDIIIIKSSSGFWKFRLRNGELYAFPVGWCKNNLSKKLLSCKRIQKIQ